MLIHILKDTSIKGVAVKAGQVVDTEQSDAIALINMGKAQPAPIVEPAPAVCPQPFRKPPRKRINGYPSTDT
jgi:hypothetical protein